VSVRVSVFDKMDKIEYRAVIKFLHLKGNSPMQIKAKFDNLYGHFAPPFATVKRWAAEFKGGLQICLMMSANNCDHLR
jgi:hypothetical protein